MFLFKSRYGSLQRCSYKMRGLPLPGCDCVSSIYGLLLNPTLCIQKVQQRQDQVICAAALGRRGRGPPDSPPPLVRWSREFSAPSCQGKQMCGRWQ